MTTATQTRKYEAVEIEFHFVEDVTKKAFDNIVRKVATVTKNAPYQSATVFFADRLSVRAIVTFDTTYADRKFYDEMRRPLTRLIDSHKEAATYGWCLAVTTN